MLRNEILFTEEDFAPKSTYRYYDDDSPSFQEKKLGDTVKLRTIVDNVIPDNPQGYQKIR